MIDLDPKNITARFYLGTSQAELKQFDDAVATFKELIKDRTRTISWRIIILPGYWPIMKRYDEAEAQFKKTLSLRPQFEAVMIDLASLYEKQKKIPEAIEVYKKYTIPVPRQAPGPDQAGRTVPAGAALRPRRKMRSRRSLSKIRQTGRCV